MVRGPRERAHREHRDAVAARTAALKEYGINSEEFKAAEARVAEAIKNLPEPSTEWDD